MPELFVWQKNLVHAVRAHDVVIIHGNIRDLYIYQDPPHHHEILFDELILRLLWPAYGAIRSYDPYAKACELSLGAGNVPVVNQLEEFGTPGFNPTIDPAIARVLSDMVNKSQRRTWMLKHMHNLMPYRSSYSQGGPRPGAGALGALVRAHEDGLQRAHRTVDGELEQPM